MKKNNSKTATGASEVKVATMTKQEKYEKKMANPMTRFGIDGFEPISLIFPPKFNIYDVTSFSIKAIGPCFNSPEA